MEINNFSKRFINCILTFFICAVLLLIFTLFVSSRATQMGEIADKEEKYDFGSVDLSELSNSDRQYLGLSGDANPISRNVDADLVILEFMSTYCTSCQKQASIFNQLYSAMAEDPELRSRVKILAIGVGNNQREVDQFREKQKVVFPILPDPKFTVYEKLLDSMRTPYTVALRKNKDANLVLVSSHLGLIRSHESYLTEIKVLMQYDEDMIKLKQQEEQQNKTVKRTELKISGEKLKVKVKEAMIKACGDGNISITAKDFSRRKDMQVYEGISGNAKYFAVVVNKEALCDVCHAVQFIYVFNEKGKVTGFETIHLTKYGNKTWSKAEVEKIRKRVLGISVLQPMKFDSEVDAITSATIDSVLIFQAISQGKDIFQFITSGRSRD